MNRLFIILAIVAIAAAGSVAWALRKESPAASPAVSPTVAAEETPDCCQPAPSRSALLKKK